MLFTNNDKSNPDIPFERLIVPFHDDSSRFHFKATNDYSKQFAHIYASRLGHMRALLEEKSKDKWGEFIKVFVQIDLCELSNVF